MAAYREADIRGIFWSYLPQLLFINISEQIFYFQITMSATATTSIVIKMQFAQILLHHLNAHVRRDTLEMDLFVPKLRQVRLFFLFLNG